MFSEQIILSIKNPILNNHQVYGEKLLPGLAYIDIIYQIFRMHDYSYKEYELKNLSIYYPLKVGENYSVMLTVSCSEMNADQWMIQIEGRKKTNGIIEDDKKLFVSAEMHKIMPVVFNETLDFNSILNPKSEILDMEKMYEQYKEQGLIHTGFMKAEGKIYNEEAATYMILSLSEDASSLKEEFLFNPVLIDGSAIGAKSLQYAIDEGEQRLFLPLFYESFKASSPLQKQCITRIKKSSTQRKGELLFLSMEFFNESGEKIAELNNCASKLVRSIELIQSNQIQSEVTKTQTELTSAIVQDAKTQTELTSAIVQDAKTSIISQNNMPYHTIVDFLRELLAEKLNKPKEQIEDDLGYYEMGLNSPDLLDLVRKIENKFGTSFSPTLLFEYTNIAALASYIEDNASSSAAHFKTAINQKIEPKVMDAKIVSGNAMHTDYDMENNTSNNKTILTNVQNDYGDSIAIIGMAGRYPKANNVREFWDNLKKGKDCISEIPKTRWDWHKFEGMKSVTGREISKWGGFIDDADCFDSRFFRISPQEARAMDPQERLFLETCWETIEDAGYTPETLVQPRSSSGSHYVGVFVGAMHKDYAFIGSDLISNGEIKPLCLGNAAIANRISYTFNFHGPSMTIDTLCASSLTAVHLAIESIRCGECDVAVAGGVNLSLHPNKYLIYGIRDMHSSDGYCHTFGNGGNGYVSAEGIGAVLLKPLHKAIEDNDTIYAVMKGSFANHGGNGSGMTVPNQAAIEEMAEMCMVKTGIDPRTISYIEAHGTGTLLGDPIEINGLNKAYKKYTQDNGFCAIGSVKSNIGHAESAAGIIGLHKVALSLYHKELVPSLHSEEPNPYIDFEQTPFKVQNKYEEWKEPFITENGETIKFPRRAGVTCIGASGSNVHVILEEYDSLQIPTKEYVPSNKNEAAIIPLSAKSKKSLEENARKLYNFLIESNSKHKITDGEIQISSFLPEISLFDLSYTLQVGRVSMKERVAFVVKDITELIRKLKSFIEKSENIENFYTGDAEHEKNYSEFDEGRVSVELIDKLIMEKKVHEIAKLWVKGYSVNWKYFYGEVTPRRIHLPTYAFEKEHFWISDNNDTSETNDNLLIDKESTESYSDLEQKIKKIWENELELDEIDVNENFVEMGGNSLIAIKIEVELANIGIYIEYTDIYTHSSVAKMASFIRMQGNENQHSNKILDNIEPFNDLYYRHCFYNALFPSIKYYEKDIIPILINDIAIFESFEHENYKLLNIRYKSNESIEQVLRKQGITNITKIASDNVVDDIIVSVSNNHPVILAIDCFYAPIRKDLYQKIHWVHYWLVYGYDTVKQEFHIIEHRHRGSMTYKKYEVTFQDLINAYTGALDLLKENEMTEYFITDYWESSEIPTYFEVNTIEDSLEMKSDTYREIFAENMINNQQSIFSGLNDIQAFEKTFEDIVLNEELLKENVEALILMINSIINAHKAELYKMNLLFQDAEDIVNSLNNVVDAWEFIRVKLSRYAYTMVYNTKSIQSAVEKLMLVYNHEKEFYEKYISYLHAYKVK